MQLVDLSPDSVLNCPYLYIIYLDYEHQVPFRVITDMIHFLHFDCLGNGIGSHFPSVE